MQWSGSDVEAGSSGFSLSLCDRTIRTERPGDVDLIPAHSAFSAPLAAEWMRPESKWKIQSKSSNAATVCAHRNSRYFRSAEHPPTLSVVFLPCRFFEMLFKSFLVHSSHSHRLAFAAALTCNTCFRPLRKSGESVAVVSRFLLTICVHSFCLHPSACFNVLMETGLSVSSFF